MNIGLTPPHHVSEVTWCGFQMCVYIQRGNIFTKRPSHSDWYYTIRSPSLVLT